MDSERVGLKFIASDIFNGSIKCAAIGCKNVKNQYALVDLIPNLKEGIPFCDNCYKELVNVCDDIIAVCKSVTDIVLCPFSEEWYEGIIRDMNKETKEYINQGCIVDDLGYIGFRLEYLISKLDKDFDGMKYVVKALSKVYATERDADC